MNLPTKPKDLPRGWRLLVFMLVASSCATASPVNPPESYKGPVADSPRVQANAYWIYEMGNASRAKTTTLMANIGFPLWIGKNWSYDVEGHRRGQPAESKVARIPMRVSCSVNGFSEIAVQAGTFDALECVCECKVIAHGFEPYCGDWKFWYAPDVKHLVKQSGEDTQNTFELTDYQGRRPPPAPKAPPRKTI